MKVECPGKLDCRVKPRVSAPVLGHVEQSCFHLPILSIAWSAGRQWPQQQKGKQRKDRGR
jgi:hypothetical protein